MVLRSKITINQPNSGLKKTLIFSHIQFEIELKYKYRMINAENEASLNRVSFNHEKLFEI